MFSKWELYEEDKRMICESFNAIWGTSSKRPVIVDVYRKKKFNGMHKYKNVIKG